MKTTLSGCGAGCEIDMALALTDVRFGGKTPLCRKRLLTSLSGHSRVHRTRPLLTQTGQFSGNNHADLKSKSSSRQSL
jgi:hypothetical protein